MLAEDAAEMREVVEAPSEGDLADVAVSEHGGGEVAPALGEALTEDVALERGVLVGEEIVDVAGRDAERRCGLGQREVGIGKMSPDMRLQPVEQGRAMGRGRQRRLAQPLAKCHRQDIDGLFRQSGGVVRFDLISTLAEPVDEIVGDPLQRRVWSESAGSKGFGRAEPALQHLARHLEDGLREDAVEFQLVGTGGVIERKFSRMHHGLAAVLHHSAGAAIAERDQDEILIRARDARGRAQHVLTVGADLGAFRLAQWRPGDRAAKGAAKIGLAVESDENVADDILPERKAAVAWAVVRGELDWHLQSLPFTSRKIACRRWSRLTKANPVPGR